MRIPKNRAPIHPGEIVLEEFLKPAGISQYRLSKDTAMSYPRINEIVKCRRPVTLDTAFRLARYFGTSPGLWTNMQTAWDLWHFQRSKNFKGIQKIEPAREMVEV